MIGSEELARQMYVAWAKRMDLLEPVIVSEYSGYHRGARPRPRWEHLTSVQQPVWRDIAREIGGVLADAMGAV